MAGGKDKLTTACKKAKNLLGDSKAITTEISELEREVDVVTELSRKAIFKNARTAQDLIEFKERNDGACFSF